MHAVTLEVTSHLCEAVRGSGRPSFQISLCSCPFLFPWSSPSGWRVLKPLPAAPPHAGIVSFPASAAIHTEAIRAALSGLLRAAAPLNILPGVPGFRPDVFVHFFVSTRSKEAVIQLCLFALAS